MLTKVVQKLLQTFRNLGNQDRLGVPRLDQLLAIFSHARSLEVDQQYKAAEFSRNQLQPHALLSRRATGAPVVELTGFAPCSGKTQLLYLITAISLIPKTYKGIILGGREGAVIWIDTEGQLSTNRLHTILHQEITRRSHSSASLRTTEIEGLSTFTLQNLHVFRPQSSLSLAATIKSLPAYLLNHSRHQSSARPLHIIIISNIGIFLAQDRVDANNEPLKVTAQHQPGTLGISNIFNSTYVDLILALQEVQRFFDCVIIAGSWSYTPVQFTTDGPVLRSHLPSAWNNFCRLRLVSERLTVSRFGPALSAGEAMQEVEKKQDKAEKGRFLCWVNCLGSEDWDDSIHTSLKQLGGNGGFSFQVTQDGVQINDEIQ